jgi:hypothetical protein
MQTQALNRSLVLPQTARNANLDMSSLGSNLMSSPFNSQQKEVAYTTNRAFNAQFQSNTVQKLFHTRNLVPKTQQGSRIMTNFVSRDFSVDL